MGISGELALVLVAGVITILLALVVIIPWAVDKTLGAWMRARNISARGQLIITIFFMWFMFCGMVIGGYSLTR